mmetsp:Transcript_53666/g.117322  ORF Transcript_53666/g.117322 Transcript_53666/m.117322 type:complete len:373 (-) Transcript_53666:156-1274(-)
MGQAFSEDDRDDSESGFHQPLPEVVLVSRRTFLSHLRNRSFDSWEELVQALPYADLPQGTSETIIKCDTVEICTWVATFLIQSCIWGLVVYFADQSMVLGALFSASYGLVLWLCVDQWLPRNMAGKLWPNLPVAVGATGTLFLLCMQKDSKDISPVGVLLCCILPATTMTLFWMRRLPEDPDRATLVTNLFLEIWAASIALRLMITGEESLSASSYSDFASLTSIGTLWVIISVLLYHFPSAWGSVELVTWTLNVGVLGVGAGTSGLLATFVIQHPRLELMGWFPFSVINGVTGLLGFKLQRSFPVLLSALALAIVSIRASLFISDVTGSTVAGICSFGLLGFAVIAAAQELDRSSQGFTAKGRRVEQARAM